MSDQDKIEALAQWEREFLERQYVREEIANKARCALLPEIEVTELTWSSKGFRTTITFTAPTLLTKALDEIHGLRHSTSGEAAMDNDLLSEVERLRTERDEFRDSALMYAAQVADLKAATNG